MIHHFQTSWLFTLRMKNNWRIRSYLLVSTTEKHNKMGPTKDCSMCYLFCYLFLSFMTDVCQYLLEDTCHFLYVVPLVFAVCTLSIFDSRDTWYSFDICTSRQPEGRMLYFDFRTIDALLLCCLVYHICMLMLFWDDSRSMIFDYLVIWCIGHIYGFCDVMGLMLWLFTSFSSFMINMNMSGVNGLMSYLML